MFDPKENFLDRLQRAILCAWVAWVALFVLLVVVFFYVPAGWYGYSAGSFDNATIDGATVAYYPISGSTADELKAQIDQGRPLLTGGRQVTAVTKWNVSWSATFDETPACKAVSADVNSTMIVLLPRWTNPEIGSLYLNLHWKEYFQYIVRHESTHVRLLRSDCHTADANGKAAFDATLRLNAEFDERTSKGLEPFVVL